VYFTPVRNFVTSVGMSEFRVPFRTEQKSYNVNVKKVIAFEDNTFDESDFHQKFKKFCLNYIS